MTDPKPQYPDKEHMITSPMGIAIRRVIRAFAWKISTLKSLSPKQLASFLESHAETIACSIYEETSKQMARESEYQAFMRDDFWINHVLDEDAKDNIKKATRKPRKKKQT